METCCTCQSTYPSPKPTFCPKWEFCVELRWGVSCLQRALNGFKPFVSMPFPNVRCIPCSLDASKIGPISFDPVASITDAISLFLFYFIFLCVFFKRAKASAKRARTARHARRGKALHALFTVALPCEQHTYFRSSLLSLRSDDRKYVCCPQAALAVARPKNAKKWRLLCRLLLLGRD